MKLTRLFAHCTNSGHLYFLLEGTSSLNVRVLAAVVAGAKTKVGPADPHRHGEGTFNTKVSLTSARSFLDLWSEPVEFSSVAMFWYFTIALWQQISSTI